MFAIKRPAQGGYYHGRMRDCLSALEPCVLEMDTNAASRALIGVKLMAEANAAGWGEGEVMMTVYKILRGRGPSR